MQFALLLHNRLAAAKILCTTKAARRAKLTMEDCLATVEPTVVITATPEVVAPVAAPVVPVVVTVPAPQIVYIPQPHEEITVTATREQVRNATPKKRVVRTTHNCIVTPALRKPMPEYPAQEK